MTEENDRVVLVYNAKIWASLGREIRWFTFNERTGTILQTGKSDPPLEKVNSSKRHDYGGKRILPGLHDAHIHVSDFGLRYQSVELQGVSSIAEFQRLVLEFAQTHQDKTWIRGEGWEQDVIGRYPSKEDLDTVSPDRPVVMFRVCHHVAVANSKALEILGVTRDTCDPEGGSIDRYPVGHHLEGEPTGLMRETAKDIFHPYLIPSEQETKTHIKTALDVCLKYGITSVHALEGDTWKTYCDLADADELPIRVFFSAFYSGRKSPTFPKPGEKRGSMLSCDRIKLFADGALGASTAAMSDEYICQSHRGLLLQSQETLDELVAEATGSGYRIEVHVIGDRAAEAALTALERADVPPDKRPILTHCQILREDLLERMQKRGVVGTVQPQFVTTDSSWIFDRLSEKVLAYSYAWKTLREKGIVCGGSSDAPVESPEPFIGMYDAVFRQIGKRDPTNDKVFRSSECLSMDEALDLYTAGGSYVTCKEAELGKIEPGYQADFVVVESSKDICEFPSELLNARALEVWVSGKKRFHI